MECWAAFFLFVGAVFVQAVAFAAQGSEAALDLLRGLGARLFDQHKGGLQCCGHGCGSRCHALDGRHARHLVQPFLLRATSVGAFPVAGSGKTYPYFTPGIAYAARYRRRHFARRYFATSKNDVVTNNLGVVGVATVNYSQFRRLGQEERLPLITVQLGSIVLAVAGLPFSDGQRQCLLY